MAPLLDLGSWLGPPPLALRFKGAHLPQEMLLTDVWWYVVSPVRTRRIAALREARRVCVDHTTLRHWVEMYWRRVHGAEGVVRTGQGAAVAVGRGAGADVGSRGPGSPHDNETVARAGQRATLTGRARGPGPSRSAG
jgi:hypothetical protein